MVAFRAQGPQTNASRCAIHYFWVMQDDNGRFVKFLLLPAHNP